MLIYIFVVFLLLGTVLRALAGIRHFQKKLPHNFLESSPLLEMPTWPFRPCASVGVKEVSTVYDR